MNQKMFCYQCQETAEGRGCTVSGVCGKNPETAALQDVLIYVTKGLSAVTAALREEGKAVSQEADSLVLMNLFVTITNANFDDDMIERRIRQTVIIRDELRGRLGQETELPEAAVCQAGSKKEMLQLAENGKAGVLSEENEDLRSLKELITYGLKGLAAYMRHADVLGMKDPDIDAFVQRTLSELLKDRSVDDLTALALETGKCGLEAMALLDRANTEAYGHPQLTDVELSVKNHPGILISGHDLRDLAMLLEQAEGTGVDIYTHCEMLPAHYYPAFRKYSCFAGHYGTAWWKQTDEFKKFHGPVLMTTNCVVPSVKGYEDRLFTTGPAGVPGCQHLEARADGYKDFTRVIEMARKCEPPEELEQGRIRGGYAYRQVFSMTDQIVKAIRSGEIQKFVVMAGCDGRQRRREYYKEFAWKLPEDTIILTAGCAKYKYIKLPMGDIRGIPRVMDAGQCNDCYSLIKTAMRLKEIFRLDDVNDLPIVYNIAWYEQKAVIVLLALLSLGIRNIHLGPTLPAFLSPAVVKILEDSFGLTGISDVKTDMDLFEIV